MAYGKQLILDLYECDVSKFNRESIEEWLRQLCVLIEMQREDLHWWDYEGVPIEERPTEPHLVGISAIQFISTSGIVIHTLDLLNTVFIDIFSCKDYDIKVAVEFTASWFGAKKYERQVLIRGRHCKGVCEIPEAGDCFDCVSHLKCTGPKWTRQPCSRFRKE